MSISHINTALMKVIRRAEVSDWEVLVSTFVDVGPLLTLISSHDHQIIYGRRGTGKTHAFSYLGKSALDSRDLPIFVDLRNVGSTGGIYSDSTIPTPERATRLLMDTLSHLHEQFLEFFVEHAEQYDLSITGPLLDRFADAITTVKVVGDVSREIVQSQTNTSSDDFTTGITMSESGVSIKAELLNGAVSEDMAKSRFSTTGSERASVHFGAIGRLLREICDIIDPVRIWLLLDEWSSLPIELQPYLADLLRRSIFSTAGITVKIAAIEQRAQFRIDVSGDYVGIEVGADAAADIDLDDFMVFDSDPNRARQFFKELLFKHLVSIDEFDERPSTSDRMVSMGFTERRSFDEFVMASEGVPRDAINIASLCARRALSDKISVATVRQSARAWYQRDKEASVSSNKKALGLLHWIIDEVIGKRMARAFLLKSGARHRLIDALFDARVLHLLKRNISTHDQPGVRYDVYKLDYGCYVDLITTARAPQGLLPMEDNEGRESFVDVPPDDYRAIRRAILDLDQFDAATA